MTNLFRICAALCLSLLLSACYNHDRGFANGKGHAPELPTKVLLAGDDGSTGILLLKADVGYNTGAKDQHVMLTAVNASAGEYWAQVSNLNKEKKRTYTSYSAKISRNGVTLLTPTPATVKSRSELLGLIKKDFRNAKVAKQSFRILNLNRSVELAEAKAFVAAAEQKKKDKEAAKNKGKTPKPTPPAPAAVKQSGQFVYTEEKDVMTGKTKQFIYAFSSPQNIGKAPYVRLGCYGRTDQYPLGLTVEWGQPLYDAWNNSGGEPVARITTKLGNSSPIELGWSMSGTRTQTYAPSAGLKLGGSLTKGILNSFGLNAPNAKMEFNWDNNFIHRVFWRQSSLALRAYAMSGQEITMQFDMADFRKVSGNFASHCKM